MQEQERDERIGLDYLSSLLNVVNALSSHHDDSMEVDDDDKERQRLDKSNIEYNVDFIARTLLFDICNPKHLVLPIPNSLVNSSSSSSSTTNTTTMTTRVHAYRQRTDILRHLFRIMAPIALDVAARIQTMVIQSLRSNSTTATTSKEESSNVVLHSFLLYSMWLPIAPQIATIVNDLFLLEDCPCPLVFSKVNHDNYDDDAIISERVLVAQATRALVEFYSSRGEHADMKKWWNWSQLYEIFTSCTNTNEKQMDCSDDEKDMMEVLQTEGGWAPRSFDHDKACKWYIARAITHLMNLSPASRAVYLEELNLHDEMVPWVIHPWKLLEEEEYYQENQMRGVATLVVKGEIVEINLPTPKEMRSLISLHPTLVDAGDGITLIRNKTTDVVVDDTEETTMQEDNDETDKSSGLQMSPTTWRNMSLLGTALSSDPFPQPVLVCGPRGSGKSCLVREFARLCNSDLLELYIDDETDSKTLIGSYVVTDVPGEFIWKPGALTDAIISGKWVLLENIETYPMEIQAALVQLFEDRILRLDGSRTERCHSNFRIFGTCTTENGNMGRGGRLLQYEIWRKVNFISLQHSELRSIGRELHPGLPDTILDSALKVFVRLDNTQDSNINSESHDALVESENPTVFEQMGRNASVREFIKLLDRISTNVHFEPGVTYATESQRTLCLAETVDVFAGWNPSHQQRRDFVINIASTIWGLSSNLALRYVEDGLPEIKSRQDFVSVGRSTIKRPIDGLDRPMDKNVNFAETGHVLQLMQKVGVCISRNEPVLLVGETGCGKTTVLQRLAALSGFELVVQNLSLQTDSTDLLGGYRPLEIRHIARTIYTRFVDLFTSTFSRTQNLQFLDYIASAFEKGQWKRLSQNLLRAAKMGINKCTKPSESYSFTEKSASWFEFKIMAERFEKQRLACDSGIAFAFTEGVLVDAIRTGKWVLLDEINLASSETLQRLCGLLDDDKRSLTLTEKGESKPINRHPNFRLLAAMNPATDVGKKDLPSSLRSRFTELYVDELVDALELRSVSARYLAGAIAGVDIEETESAINSVDTYLKCRQLAEDVLVDSAGQKPRYTLRSMCRALSAARTLMIHQKFSPKRSLLEGFELAFEGPLDASSKISLKKLVTAAFGKGLTRKELDHPGRRPEGKANDSQYVLVKPFWIKAGENEQIDWSERKSAQGPAKFVLTPSMMTNLRRLVRSVASGPWPILLEGPTSAGKTTLVEYLAARTGNHCVRINNHEHTDVQEYTGSYAADSNGKICFKDGILVQALRKGHWVILDELNLAPSEVLEALNRLLDDNRELYLAEINEVVKPHPNFRLFATQNPAGVYGGRKPLSKAFRNRFVEIHVGDIPEQEMISILEKRCGCPPSHAKILVKVMSTLRKRRSRSSIFQGKDGLITPRDLLRWAGRNVNSKEELAIEGYMLLAERLRNKQEKEEVKQVIEEHFKIVIDVDNVYYGNDSESRRKLEWITTNRINLVNDTGISPQEIAPTRSLLRLLTLVQRCVQHQEPVLLVGETGCGKTTVVQLMSLLLSTELHTVNCHATSETSDFLGGLRPLRGRHNIFLKIIEMTKTLAFEVSKISNLRDISITDEEIDQGIKNNGLESIKSFIKTISDNLKSIESTNDRQEKRRKLESNSYEVEPSEMKDKLIKELIQAIELEFNHYNALFEWIDGPLVTAMKSGHLFLLDEMSLAEDAVLERLNSILEPTRTLVLAEKGGDSSLSDNSSEATNIKAHQNFRIFATMNPGGDFGKRELSPALRSRFTEIWVPAVKDRVDIGIILQRSLYPTVETKASVDEAGIASLGEKILDYIDWFNNTLCSSRGSKYIDFTLSLRDVLSWARFIIDARSRNKNIGLWKAYVHGALLMHLDGLGLGTGLSQQDSMSAKIQAKEMLKDQVPLDEQKHVLPDLQEDYEKVEESSLYEGKRFGIKPFLIPIGSELTTHSPSNRFNFNAPTTGLNLKRVLRALQLSKPILLEGSPGVGKTSLITALAKASGNKLVRINLSEQTDIADLMGSDQPIAETNIDGVDSGLFRWCDGILLKAIKQGQWVLLDELNLASQSVLEGLNSCLDHRASVYIPEISKTFDCPASFRIFAAQNPLAQGGGRKGLPKSFLNRFTKVYVEALSPDDLYNIVLSQFPNISEQVVKKMISFNTSIQSDIENGKYGQSGSPWEFNLRDIFRWCELVCKDGDAIEGVARGEYVNMIYTQRMRNPKDREMIHQKHQQEFGSGYLAWKKPTFHLDEVSISVGNAKHGRFSTRINHFHKVSSGSIDPTILHSLMTPTESAGYCVEMKWPCLLVGSPSSGKSTIVKVLSESSNVHLEEVSLTPATDVSELIGCFEQTDVSEIEIRLLKTIDSLSSHSSLTLIHSNDQVESLKEILRKHWTLNQDVKKRVSVVSSSFLNESGIMKLIEEILKQFEKASLICCEFSESCSQLVSLLRDDFLKLNTSYSYQKKKSGIFRWVDGVLVQALEKGHWLHLENVNLCPSSVLDRLNPLLEGMGYLELTECGVNDSAKNEEESVRKVQVHPNFRLFLSMNPSYGEISRAMRNRCIEVYLVQNDSSQAGNLINCKEHPHTEKNKTDIVANGETIDQLEMCWHSGIRSTSLAKSLYTSHCFNPNSSNKEYDPHTSSSRILRYWALLVTASLKRGFIGQQVFQMTRQIAYGLNERESEETTAGLADDKRMHCLVEGRELEMMMTNPQYSIVTNEARLLRSFICDDIRLPLALSSYNTGSDEWGECLNLYSPPLNSNDKRLNSVKLFLLAAFASRVNEKSSIIRASFLDGFDSTLSMLLHFLVSRYCETVERMGVLDKMNGRDPSYIYHSHQNTRIRLLQIAYSERLASIGDQYLCFKTLDQMDTISIETLNVIEASYCLHENKIDRSSISCPITPFIYPLFNAIQTLYKSWEGVLVSTALEVDDNCLSVVKNWFSCVDRMWDFLSIKTDEEPFLGIDDASFIVHWTWLKKSMGAFNENCWKDDTFSCDEVNIPRKRLNQMIKSLDSVLFDNNADYRITMDSIRKKGGYPFIPRLADDWNSIHQLQLASRAFSYLSAEICGIVPCLSGYHRAISLKSLIDDNHASLFIGIKLKRELLTALCTLYWATTIEIPLSDSNDTTNKSLGIQEISKHVLNKVQHVKAEFVERLEGAQNDQILSEDLMKKFGSVQVTQIIEFWCIKEERWIIDSLSTIVLELKDNSMEILKEVWIPRVKTFIDVVLSHDAWSVHDLRPYQTLVWAFESPSFSFASLSQVFDSLFSRLVTASSRHCWFNTFTDVSSVSSVLALSVYNAADYDESQEVTSNEGHTWNKQATTYGVPCLKNGVLGSFFFHLLGLESNTEVKIPFMTLENFHIRQSQTGNIIRFISKCSKGLRDEDIMDISTTRYLFSNTIKALIESSDIPIGSQNIWDIQTDHHKAMIRNLIRSCKHDVVRNLTNEVIDPLLDTFQRLHSSKSKDLCALASIYTGLLRFHAVLPRSALDPGKKPFAKMLQWEAYIEKISAQIAALRMEFGLSTGCFEPKNEHVSSLIKDVCRADNKRLNQDKKRIERPSSAPQFSELYQELHHFSKTIANVDNVLQLVKCIESSKSNSTQYISAWEKELNWQSSVTMFCGRIISKYACYEDVLYPVLAALSFVQNGLRNYAHYSLQSKLSSEILSVGAQLLQYPNNNFVRGFHEEVLKEINDNFSSDETSALSNKTTGRFQMAYLISVLSNIHISLSSHAIKYSDVLPNLSCIFSSVVASFNEEYNSSSDIEETKEGLNETEDERNERAFRDQFPDHEQEFNEIIKVSEQNEMDNEQMPSGVSEQTSPQTITSTINHEHLLMISDLHSRMFSTHQMATNDFSRIGAFQMQYEAASYLNSMSRFSDTIDPNHNYIGAHCFAIGLKSALNTCGRLPSKIIGCRSTNRQEIDFYHEPNPDEVAKAARPLNALLNRIVQLLAEFPGNTLLEVIGHITRKLIQKDLSTVSVGKMLTGLEVILRKAQEWEQHASRHVALGKNLTDISNLVANWRKLEMKSWSDLLNVRENKYSILARKFWVRLYRLLIVNTQSDHKKSFRYHSSSYNTAVACHCCPNWVWRGSRMINVDGDNTIESIEDHSSIIDLLKTLDTFLLTSNLGQFNERLRLVDVFSNQLLLECQSNEEVCVEKLILGMTMRSLHEHYAEFLPSILAAKERLCGPIETKLKDEVKLAKWDEQSYYALAESTEKSHRKLMSFVHEYEEVLDTPVSKLLEENFIDGIRSTTEISSTSVKPVTDIPSDTSIFPNLCNDHKNEDQVRHNQVFVDSYTYLRKTERAWANGISHDLHPDKYIKGIQKYSRKMRNLFAVPTPSFAKKGAEEAICMTDTIFARIKILRDKGTKTMKQRALFDLFKYTKDGLPTSIHWSIPEQMRNMSSILQLPTPQNVNLSPGFSEVLKQGEKYFRRCTVELTQLRAEVAMFGSTYLTQNDTKTMISLSEHGVTLLCQQRCNLSSIIQNLTSINHLMECMDKTESKFPNQENLMKSVDQFDQSFSLLRENLKQLSLVVRTLVPLNETQDSDKGRQIINNVEGLLSVISECYHPQSSSLMVSFERLAQINGAIPMIQNVQEEIDLCTRLCNEYSGFPAEIFDPIKAQLDILLTDAFNCKERKTKRTRSSNKIIELMSGLVQRSLLAAQSFQHTSKAKPDDEDSTSDDDGTVWDNHRHTLEEWQSINVVKIREVSFELLQEIRQYNIGSNGDKQDDIIWSMCCDASHLLLQIMDRCQSNLGDYIEFYRSAAKLEYIKLRIFRILVAKGYCADNTKESEDDDDAEGDINDMKFEDDADGTGMGEGIGSEDVTDQIENEEQLLGLKGDEEKEDNAAQDQKELNEDEADTGMEMENNFDGDLYDVPEKEETKEDNNEENEDEEELDREMGDGSDPNEQVVDEKMWDEDESDEEGEDMEDEKFEKESKMDGETLQDELRTKEGDGDEDPKPESKEDENGNSNNDDEKPQDEENGDGDNDINNDYEDDYEDKHVGVDVRNDDVEEEEKEDDEVNSLDDNINLDEEDDDGDGNDESKDNGEDDTDIQMAIDEDNDEDVGNDDDNKDNEDEDDQVEQDITNPEQVANKDESQPDDDNKEEENKETSNTSKQERKSEDSANPQGVFAEDGEDNVDDTQDGENTKEDQDMQLDDNMEDNKGSDAQGGGQGNDDGDDTLMGSTSQSSGQTDDHKNDSEATDVPNPFSDPGEAEKFWHRKLNMITETDEKEDNTAGENEGNQDKEKDNYDEKNTDGMFEFVSANEEATTQVLGANDDEEDPPVSTEEHDNMDEKEEKTTNEDSNDKTSDQKVENKTGKKSKNEDKEPKSRQSSNVADDKNTDESDSDSQGQIDDEPEDESKDSEKYLDDPQQNEIVTDLSQLQVDAENKSPPQDTSNDLVETSHVTTFDMQQTIEAQLKWSQIQSETHSLSQRLCEKLRLVMEPLLKTKLRGDYRSGKRINMKRVIGYIASNYRKDKIWLRRTKPAKRDYRVLLAIDNSESMKKGGAGDKALAALSTMANGMRQLEIGELGIASFGEEMRLLHPFDIPFTASSGVDLVSNFTFSDKRTETALCVESAMAALGSQVDTSSTQLVFMISDGRIEKDSRLKLRKLVREMSDRNILLVMMIVEGSNKKDSVVTMKEVTFENGKPKVKHFIEGYPFPYYIVLNDMNTLPEILGDALRQWFEALAQNQTIS